MLARNERDQEMRIVDVKSRLHSQSYDAAVVWWLRFRIAVTPSESTVKGKTFTKRSEWLTQLCRAMRQTQCRLLG
jgi:hypothetical protein